ncbi:hypothetical protein B0F90DRAFT_1667129 [Multifurca ochricompacta]|uniref:Uncharacterized protein n=1 Tax=Multifurca ochricompacta TaxID=376703 RepID=A0AAD4QPZ3_9AGAM|nr:hypothetical protein B0F90DRAFT_1667129 [Multifurca ochricompacta]
MDSYNRFRSGSVGWMTLRLKGRVKRDASIYPSLMCCCLREGAKRERFERIHQWWCGEGKVHGQQQLASNVDGAVRDEDVFVIGDEDEGEDIEVGDGEVVEVSRTTEWPLYRSSEPENPLEREVVGTHCVRSNEPDEPPDGNQASLGKYYIQPDDTLLGISLRLGVDGYCIEH